MVSYDISQIKGDLEKSMNGVFQKYDGANAEAHAVDYLQRQVRLIGSFISLQSFLFALEMTDAMNAWAILILFILPLIFYITCHFYISRWSAVGWITSQTGLQYHGLANITTLCHFPAAKQMLHNVLAK